MNITTVGIDLAKDIITVHAQNTQGHCVVARNLRFNELAEWLIQLPAGCVVGMEPVVQPTTGDDACKPWDCSPG